MRVNRNAMVGEGRRLRSLAIMVLLVAVAPLLMGATAQRMWKDGTRLEEQGSYYPAALKYLDALDKNPRHRKAGASIVAVAEQAYEEKLEIAAAYEADGRFPDALEEYEELFEFLRRLKGVNAGSFATVDVGKKIGEMADASAEQQYQGGAQALAAGRWKRSISHFRAAQSFRRGYRDTDELIATAEYGWAEQDLEARNYRSSAAHFVAADEGLGGAGFRDAAVRAAGLYAALGRHFLEQGACRQAVSDLQSASKLAAADRVAGLLEQAEDCAVTPVAISAFENSTGRNVAGMALGELLSDQTAGKVDERASRYVRLLERRALDRILAEQGLSQAGIATGSSSQVRGVRYLVFGKLTQVRVDSAPPRRSARSTTGSRPYSCTKTNSRGDAYSGVCHSEVTVEYIEVEQSLAIQISGSVTVVDVKTGEQLTSRPIEASAQDSVHFVESPSVDGRGVELTMWQHNDGIGVRERDIRRLVEARRLVVDEGVMAAQVVDSLSSQASEAVIQVVDVAHSVRDPAELTGLILD